MTREDYLNGIKRCHSSSQHVDLCEEYIKSLEQRIAELEIVVYNASCDLNDYNTCSLL